MYNNMKTLLPLLLLLLITGLTAFKSTNPPVNDQDIVLLKDTNVRSALETLMKSGHPYGFVTIEVKGTEKFVQFAGCISTGLLFDLPTNQLNEAELEKAIAVLKPYGIEHETRVTYKDESKTEIRRQLSLFSKNLKGDVNLAVELTSRVIIDVFGENEDATLIIKGN
jgi:hypothetical protein